MLKILLIIHIILSCLIIMLILLDKSKGADAGATFSTTNTELINIKESNTLIRKIITSLAIIMVILSISINVINYKNAEIKNQKPIIKLLD